MQRVALRARTILLDTAIAGAAFAAAYHISPPRVLGAIPGPHSLTLLQLVALYAALAAGFSLLFRRELSPWRYTSIPDAAVLARVAVLTVGVFLVWVFVLDRASSLPRSTLFLAPFLQMTGTMGVRILRRALHEHVLGSFAPFNTLSDRTSQGPHLLLVGPPAAADSYLRDVARNHDRNWSPVGIVAPDRQDVGHQVRGVCIIDSLDNLDEALADLRRWNRYPRAILLLDEPTRLKGLTADVLGRLKNDGIRMLRLPSIVELGQHDGVTLLPMREINIEELLARDPIQLDRGAIAALVRGRRVLVTGAGGSIGAELCRQAVAFECGHITMVDYSETALFEIERELGETSTKTSRRGRLCDVRNAARLGQLFEEERPDLVFHAAALKHVSMVERHPCEGVLTNVIGTWNVAEAATACGARHMVLISTDKAVDPTNVMGATKRLAESVIRARQGTSSTRFAAVRFGNVLGSAGSVVPIFKSQIERGGPVTVTHKDMTRYFMTIPESVSLIVQAGAIGGRGDVFVLDMGKPVSIFELAQNMIRLSGKVPEQDIAIRITGVRPGEKLHEVLWNEDEAAEPTAHAKILAASQAPIDADWLDGELRELERLVEEGATLELVSRLTAMTRAPQRVEAAAARTHTSA